MANWHTTIKCIAHSTGVNSRVASYVLLLLTSLPLFFIPFVFSSDSSMFPKLAKKIDISHLESHHHELEQSLAVFSKFSLKLRRLESSDQFDRLATEKIITDLTTLVNTHEKAEEAVVAAENLKKYFTEKEVMALH